MRSHTPGPWVVHRWSENLGIVEHTGNARGEIALIDRQHPEAEENARLIASAPDLLEACELAEEWIDIELRAIDEEDEAGQLVLTALRAAIAKVRGGGA